MHPAEWERIQEIERRYHDAKDHSRVLDYNLPYWQRILGAIPEGELRIGPETRVLDVGCGGAGILLAVEGGRRTGLDPLMPYYLEKFPFLSEHEIDWRKGTAEDLHAGEPFDVVFSINMLDHVYDPRAAAGQLRSALAPGGRLVVLLNVHLTRAYRWWFSKTYRWIDPPHPHHFHRDDVPALFPELELRFERDVDDLWLDLRERYQAEVRGQRTGRLAKLAKAAANPFKWPLAAARLLAGRPVHRRRAEDRPLIAGKLFVFAAPER